MISNSKVITPYLPPPMMSRIQKLRDDLRRQTHTKYRVVKNLTILDDEKSKVEPIVVRKALALALLLDETPPVILENELIAGLRQIYGVLRTGENVFGTSALSPQPPATPHKLEYYPHYLRKTEVQAAQKAGIREAYAMKHIPFGVQKVLELGYGGIKEEVVHKMRELRDSRENAGKMDFLRAVIITLDAASHFAVRHAREAERLAQETDNHTRQAELAKIAEACHWISRNPPRTFYEALQLWWFTYVIVTSENAACIPPGRVDQDFYPYYKRDVEEGRLSKEEAQELVECLWIKLNLEEDLMSDVCGNATLSGQDSEGYDVTNELTYMFLNASLHLRLTNPKVNVRFHQNSPIELLQKCSEMVKAGIGGFPCFFNDEAIIPGLQRIDIPIEDARLYCNNGCQEIIVPGKGDFYPTHSSIDFLECLLEVLHRPIEFKTFEELMKAYKKELSTTIESTVIDANIRDSAMAKYSPVPFLSSTLEGCIENAMDKTEGGSTYNYSGLLGLAYTNAANSLAAIKHFVYDEEMFSLATLRDILRKNWEGYERARQHAINKIPKFGNDDNYVDSLAIEVADYFINEVLKYRNPRGGLFYPGIFTFWHVTKGKEIAASPDGRKAGDPVAAHVNPVIGTDLSGPTAVANSAAKICKLKPPEGTALGVRFHPSALHGEVGTRNLMSFIQTFMDRGGYHVQFNVVDSETLKDAQIHPEHHKDLVVRVWGFSAYFVTLIKDYQDELIARTEHTF